MNILLLGSGGREHALAWKICQSKKCGQLYIAPGNAGTAAYGINLDLSVNDFNSIKAFVLEKNIEMVVVGPEDPLVNGIHDFFLNDTALEKIPVIGPQKGAAQLEGSKDFAKNFLKKHNIPTAAFGTFSAETISKGLAFLETLKPPYVLKADGLAAGKGVIICNDLGQAQHELKLMLEEEKFGEAGRKVVIEEFLNGIELSVFVITDGKNYKILPTSKDYKRVGEGDTGLNTGGMGAVSPVPFADEVLLNKVEERIIKPTINGLIDDGLKYKGFIYFGLMNMNGDPFVIEYNVRLGDPEAEVILPRINNDIVELFEAVADGSLEKVKIEIDERSTATIILTSGGYPGNYEKGKVITGIDQISGSTVFHAGTRSENGQLLTNGGRVLAVTSFGDDIFEALETSRTNAEKISFEGKYYRSDIGFDLKRFVVRT